MIEDFIDFFIQLGGILLFLYAVYFFLPENIKDKLNPFLKDLYTLLETGDEYLKYRILHSFIEMMEHRPTGGGFLPIDLYLWKFINDGDMKKLIDSLPGSSGSAGGLF